MATVTPTDTAGYTQYIRDFNEVEDELREDAQASQRRKDEEVREIREGTEAALEEQQEDSEEAAEGIRETAQKDLKNERDAQKAEIARVRRETYDRQGRFNEEKLRNWEETNQATREEFIEAKARNDQRTEELETYYEKLFERQRKDSSAEREEAVRRVRDAGLAAYNKLTDEENDQFRAYRKELQDDYAELSREHAYSVGRSKSEALDAIEKAEKSYETLKSQSNDQLPRALDQQRQAYLDRLDENARSERASRESEMGALRSQVSELVSEEQSRVGKAGEQRARAIAEMDSERKGREARIRDAYESQIDNLKVSQKEQERHFTRLFDEKTREKDQFFARKVQDLNSESAREMNRARSDFDRSTELLENEHAMARQKFEESLENQYIQSNLEREKALNEQARVYQEVLSRAKTAADQQIDQLENRLHQSRTTEDIGMLSPAAEARLREQLTEKFDHQSQAEISRNQIAREQMRQRFMEDMNELRQGVETEQARREMQFAVEQNRERRGLLGHIHAIEEDKRVQIEQIEAEMIPRFEKMQTEMANVLDKQRRQYETIIAALSMDAEDRISAIRQESEFQRQIEHRNVAFDKTQLIRDYETKIAQMQDDAAENEEKLSDELRRQMFVLEKDLRAQLESQERHSRQEVLQLEQQFSEKERTLVKNYEETINNLPEDQCQITRKEKLR